MKKIISIFLVFGLFLTSCDKFFDVNTDPNNPAYADYEYIFPAAVASTATVTGGQYAMLGSLWSQHFTQNNSASQYQDLDSYQFTNNKFARSWTEIYAGALNDYAYVIRESAAGEDWQTHLMAVVMRCYTFAVMVDLYDSVPYSDALNGTEGVIAPAYDSGQDIYDGLITEIDEALGQDFTLESNRNIGEYDQVFGGDLDKWVQFANTLKLKLYLRQVNARSSVAQAGVQALYTAGANFLTEAAALDVFINESGRYNPLYGNDISSVGLNDNNLRASQTLFNYLNGTGDSRAAMIYRPATGQTDIIAHAQGDYNNKENSNLLAHGRWDATQPVYFFTEAEVYFLQAEALARFSGLGGNASDMYEMGVRASFDRLEASGADVLLAGSYNYGSASDKIRLIITQKWVSQAMYNPIESFFDFNRTGFPSEFTVSTSSVIGSRFPKRLRASDTTEGQRNPNTPMDASIEVKVWWAL